MLCLSIIRRENNHSLSSHEEVVMLTYGDSLPSTHFLLFILLHVIVSRNVTMATLAWQLLVPAITVILAVHHSLAMKLAVRLQSNPIHLDFHAWYVHGPGMYIACGVFPEGLSPSPHPRGPWWWHHTDPQPVCCTTDPDTRGCTNGETGWRQLLYLSGEGEQMGKFCPPLQ